MTIDEAIKNLTARINGGYPYQHVDTGPALRLALEALKAVKECRASNMLCPGMLMPGETEE